MKHEFEPFKGTGTIHFGTGRQELRNLLGPGYKEFRRNQFSKNTTDYYESLCLFLSYDANDNCNAIEFTDEGNLYHNGENLLVLSYDELVKRYSPLSSNIEVEDEVGICFYDLGFAATKKDDGTIESLMIFSAEYWD